jgi:hypothetical protein
MFNHSFLCNENLRNGVKQFSLLEIFYEVDDIKDFLKNELSGFSSSGKD